MNLNKIEKFANLQELNNCLEEIYLQGNKMKNFDNVETQNLTNLKKLDISNNQLTNVRGVTYLRNLTYLNIENNIIFSIKGKNKA